MRNLTLLIFVVTFSLLSCEAKISTNKRQALIAEKDSQNEPDQKPEKADVPTNLNPPTPSKPLSVDLGADRSVTAMDPFELYATVTYSGNEALRYAWTVTNITSSTIQKSGFTLSTVDHLYTQFIPPQDSAGYQIELKFSAHTDSGIAASDTMIVNVAVATPALTLKPVTLDETAQVTLTNKHISSKYGQTAESDLIIRVVTTPAQGKLFLSGNELTAGNSFTQADIAAGNVSYRHLYRAGSDSLTLRLESPDERTSEDHALSLSVTPYCTETTSALAPFAGGTGTASDPYLICSVPQFNAIGTTHGTAHFFLLNDLDFTNTALVQAGGDDGLNGSFHGRHYKMEHISIDQPTTIGTAPFRIVKGVLEGLRLDGIKIKGGNTSSCVVASNSGTISDVNLTNCHFELSVNNSTTYGGIVGSIANTGIIRDVTAEVTVHSTIPIFRRIGGIAGFSQGTIDSATASLTVNSVTDVNVSAIGAIIGDATSGAIEKSHGSVHVTFNTGTVYQIGGLSGKASNASFNNSSGDLNFECSCNGDYIGGAIASAAGLNVDNVTGKIQMKVGESSVFNRVGGLIGAFANTPANYVTNSHATGNISGRTFTGGLIGACTASSHISNSFADVNITSTLDQTSRIGGLVGDSTNCLFERVFAKGDISASALTDVSNIGGLIGAAGAATTVVASYSHGAVSSSGTYIGGLIGSNAGRLKDSYAIGNLSGAAQVGGLIGINSGSIARSVWNLSQSGVAFMCGSSTGTGCLDDHGKSTSAMKQLDLYKSLFWDFAENVNDGLKDSWTLPANSYPEFAFQHSIAPTTTIPFDGSGTTDDPYLISSADEFNLIDDNVFLMDKSFRLKNNIDFTGKRLVPIGSAERSFTGNFDGAHKEISNITTIAHLDNFGLIGHAQGTTIKNLKVKSFDFSGSVSNVGGVVGTGIDLRVSNISLHDMTISGKDNVAGFIGNSAILTAENMQAENITISGSRSVAALVGKGTLVNLSDATVKDISINASYGGAGVIGSFTSGVITTISLVQNSKDIVASGGTAGGLCGGGAGQLKDINIRLLGTSKITAAQSHSGGICGKMSGVSENTGLTVFGDETAHIESFTWIGGAFGELLGSASYSKSWTDIKVVREVSGNEGENTLGQVGGFAGSVTGVSITESYALGDVISKPTIGCANAGGFVGVVSGKNSVLSKNFARGNVEAMSAAAGGFIGWINNADVTDNYATGNVTAGKHIANNLCSTVPGASYAGGFVGFNRAGIISRNYATGSVTATGASAGGFSGGIYHTSPVTITANFSSGFVTAASGAYGFMGNYHSVHASTVATNNAWDVTRSGRTTVRHVESHGLLNSNGVNTADAPAPDYFFTATSPFYVTGNWDFNETWVEVPGGYPKLAWE